MELNHGIGCELTLRGQSNLRYAIATLLCLSAGFHHEVVEASPIDDWGQACTVVNNSITHCDWFYNPKPEEPNDDAFLNNDGGNGSDSDGSGSGTAAPNANPEGECAGNPIVYSTGNKIESESDFIAQAADKPLFLSRMYNHHWKGVGLFGKHWVSNLDYKLTFGTTDVNSCYPRPGGGTCGVGVNTTIFAWRPNGTTIKYIRNPNDGVFYEDKADPVSKIVVQGNGSFVLYGEQGQTESYSSAGYVARVQDRNTVGWSYSYSGTYPQQVVHDSGKYIGLTWTNGQLTAVRDPAGNYYGYAYTANVFGAGIHRLSAVSQPGAPATTVAYHYEVGGDPGALTGKSFNGARYSTFTYDANGFATSSEHGGLEKFAFSYALGNAGEMTVTETNPLGKRATYTFQDGRLLTTTGQPSTYCPAMSYAETEYDANGYPVIQSDRNGNDTAFTYNAKGQLIRQVEAYGTPRARTTEYVWNTIHNRIVSEAVVGVSRTNYDYDSNERLSRVTVTNLSSYGVAGQSRSTWYSYDYYAPVSGTMQSVGMLAHQTTDGPLPGMADAVVKSYDTVGNLVSVRNGLGHTITYSNHNGLGLPGRVVGLNGDVTDIAYDARGRIVLIRTYPNGGFADTTYTYTATGKIATVTSADGVVMIAEYDAGQRLIRRYTESTGVLAGAGTREELRYGYNLASDILSTAAYTGAGHYETQYRFRCLQPRGASEYNCTEPDYVEEQVWVDSQTLNRAANTDYDELSRPRAQRGNNGQNERFTYDDNGNVQTITDSLNRVTTNSYDELDRVVTSINAVGGITRFEYNADDRLTRVTDPRGLITSYVYDGFGQLWAQYSPDTGTTQYQYDSAGQQTYMSRNDGSALAYQYDGLGRPTYVGNADWARYYSYDWCTNGKGLLCGLQVNDPNSVHSWTHFGYTPEGRVSVRRDSVFGADDWTGYSYDSAGRLVGMSYPSGVSVGYGYTAGKLVLAQATISGITQNIATNFMYRPFGDAQSWTFGNGLNRLMERDLDGRLKTIHTDNYQGLYYGFSANDEIVSIVNGRSRHHDQNFSYDALSRLTVSTSPSGNQNIAYDASGNRTQHNWLVAAPYTVDPSSNRASEVDMPFTYDGRGNRRTQSWGGSTATYAYDAYNHLLSVGRDVASSYTNPNYAYQTFPAGTTTYKVNALDQRVGKSGPLGTSRYVYGGHTQLLAEQSNGQWTSYLWVAGTPVALVRNNQLYFIHNDHLGRPDIVTDGARNAVWYAANYAFDRQVLHDQLGELNLGFPGQYFDRETGFWHNGFREYDGRAGRYLQSDPIGLSGGLNTYAYVGGNPTDTIDPSGLEGIGPWTYAPGQNYGGTPCQQAAISKAGIDISINISPVAPFELIANLGFDTSLNPMTWGEGDKRYAAAVGAAGASVFQAQQMWDSSRVSPYHNRYQDLLGRPNSGLGPRNAASTAAKLSQSTNAMRSASRMRTLGGPVLGAIGALVSGAQDLRKCACSGK